MKVPTANIIVTYSRESMDRLFAEGATYTSLMQTLTANGSDDTLMFNAESNPNFISFEHSFGFGPGTRMKLKFIDPKGTFEKRFISSSLLKNVAGSRYKSKDSKPSILSAKNSEGMKLASSEYSEEFYDDLKKQYTEQFGVKEIYIAYGSGDNLDLWSGPHKTMIENIDISVKGAREILLTLSPTPQALDLGQRRGSFNEEVNLNLAGLTMRFSGESKPIVFLGEEGKGGLDGYDIVKPYDPLKYLNLETNAESAINKSRDEIKQAFGDLDLDSLVSTVEDFDIHSIIVDTLRSYIQKATGNPNVIVLLPNINVICRESITKLIKNSRVAWEKVGDKPPYFGGFVIQAIRSSFINSRPTREIARKYELVRSLLEEFDLNIYSRSIFDFGSIEKSIPQAEINQMASVEKKKSASLRFESEYTEKDYFAILERASNKGIPDHMAAVKGVIEKINAHSTGQYPIRLGLFTETETKVLDFWSSKTHGSKGCTHYPLFGGYHKFDEEREAIIVGDIALIEKYLYAKIDLTSHMAGLSKLNDLASAAKTKRKDHKMVTTGTWDSTTKQYTSTQADFEVLKAEDAVLKSNVDAAVTAKLMHIPLHPLDRAILTNSYYNRDLKKIIFPPFTGSLMGSFGDITYLPDEFGYSEFSEDKKKYIKEKSIPIFRYNTTNPNVLDIKFKFASIYFSQLQTGFQKMVSRKASAVASGVLPLGTGTFPITTRGAAAQFLRVNNFSAGTGDEEKAEILQELATRISPELAKSMESDELLAADGIAAILKVAEQDNLQGYVEIEQGLPGNPNAVMASMAEGMYRDAHSMDITTLPIFHLTSVATINNDCILFAQDTAIMQSQEPKRSAMNSFFSGLYRIMGFRHTINSTTAKSEFQLVKNAVKYDIPEEEKTEEEKYTPDILQGYQQAE
tara:strand:- start:1110 stop:3845 length:2736 start_codon:yes stop_codon:yes gene_type:complete